MLSDLHFLPKAFFAAFVVRCLILIGSTIFDWQFGVQKTMQQSQKKIVIVGATGVTGSQVVKHLCANAKSKSPVITQVLAITRAPLSKTLLTSNTAVLINTVVSDFDQGLNKSHFTGYDTIIITLGAGVNQVGIEVRVATSQQHLTNPFINRCIKKWNMNTLLNVLNWQRLHK